ncbi:SDR family oxidoreductase [Saccharopolyspora sp. HNM0983]|uniref:SDR family oxidoreductase n=1 Tax=Saccharopolyspora montiporae TaxID=2781240 RepID=A0A929B5Z3_9PSEU|nr:SDR family oxidoreductase [Saccharopolyspora sp. HNM0983]MBE9373789.1 SDR family oxidoreductase [Saccharopolyspora sp. HNM0983]
MPRFDPHPQRRPAVVAGASSGIGLATAQVLATAGHPVALGARRVSACEETAATIRAGGGEAVALPLDVTDGDSVKGFAAAAEEALGPIEVVVSGAGDIDAALIHEQDPDTFDQQVRVHLGGAQRLTAELVPPMIRRRRGDVVFLSSDVARSHRPRMGGYVPAKTGLEAMVRTMQMELEGTGVRASMVRPGPTKTGMGTTWEADVATAVLQDWVHWGLARHPYFLRASDVAAAVAAVIGTQRGAQLTVVEVEPEAPLRDEDPAAG